MTLSVISKGILTEIKAGGSCSGITSNQTLFTVRPVSTNLSLASSFSKVICHISAIVGHTHMIHSSGSYLNKAFTKSSAVTPSATNLTDNHYFFFLIMVSISINVSSQST